MLLARLAVLLCFVAFSSADLFTSIADMQLLLDSEKYIPTVLEKYIKQEEKRLHELRTLVAEYTDKNEKQMETGIEDLANPINAFLMIKRKIFDWKNIEEQMKSNGAEGFLQRLADTNYGIRQPSEEDMTGAAIGLLRLQDTYRLDTKELANGRIYGVQSNYSFSAFDCFEIARAAYNQEDYYHVILWMEEAMKRNDNENPPTANNNDILEYLAFSLYKQGNLKRALKYTEELYKADPTHPRAKGNVKWYEDLLEQDGVKKNDMRRNIPSLVNVRPEGGLENNERSIYEALCRNEVPVSPKQTSKLYCYLKRDNPFLFLAPFKVEIVRFNPLAVLFRDVLSEEEIDTIKELATPKLARATVQDSQTGQLVTATYRISKSAWLKGYDHEVVERVNARLEQMTNLEMETAEELQIANYGIGGHYDPHFDHARKEEVKAFADLGTGNRIATVLLYMSSPQIGGGTAFTEVKSIVFPSKRDALFWYNLHRFGDGDARTRHAACPVLVGIKWVSNKWIHEAGQEFRRPCGLNMHDAERYVGDLGGPEPRNHPNLSPFPKKEKKGKEEKKEPKKKEQAKKTNK